MFGFTRWRRKSLLSKPVPDAWRRALARHVALYRFLADDDRARLHGHLNVLLAEKNFEACGGLRLTDDMRVAVAGQAAVLLLGRDMDYFPALRTVLIYPSGYSAPVRDEPIPGVVHEEVQEFLGESWEHGTVVLAWDKARRGGLEADGVNLVHHEFAHQIDEQFGLTGDGAPEEWRRVLDAAYRALRRAVNRGENTAVDPYGAENPAEFFAVATECFFEAPEALRRFHPAFYGKMVWLYNQDPSRFFRGRKEG